MDRQAIRLIDGRGHLITEVHDYRVESRNSTGPQDVNGDGTTDIVIVTWSGGAHGSNRYFVWSLGDHPRCLVGFDKNNVSGTHDFDFVDLDGDGRKEIRSWYDGFYHLDTGPGRFGLSAGPLPLALRYEHGRYVDRTNRFPKLYVEAVAKLWAGFGSDLRDEAFGPKEKVHHLAATGLLALVYEFGRSGSMWKDLRAKLGPLEYAWYWRNRWIVRQVVADRYKRYSHPRVGSRICPNGIHNCKALPAIRVPFQ